MKKHIGSFLLMLILLITMAGCGSMEKEMTEGEKDKEDKIQIGLCFDSFVIERWQRDRDIFRIYGKGAWSGGKCSECQWRY